jgi:hypothetical protein
LFGYCVLGLGAGLGDIAGDEVGATLRVAVANGVAFTSALADGAAETAAGDPIAEGAPDGLPASGTLAMGRLCGGADAAADAAGLPEPPAQAATMNARAIVHPIRARLAPTRVVLRCLTVAVGRRARATRRS